MPIVLVPLYHSVPADAPREPVVLLVNPGGCTTVPSLILDLRLVHQSHTLYVTLVPRECRLSLTTS